jgi:CheY-like chemotaxis protein
MLQKSDDPIAGCYERAARSAQRAKSEKNASIRADLLLMEKTWTHLAQSYEFIQSLESFLLNADRFTADLHKPTMISIVDDDPYAREATQTLLQALGYTAISFRSADDFLSSGRINDTACVITDVQMPGKSGFELHQRLLADGRQTPFIFMSAYPEKYRDQYMKSGATGFLSKPFREEALIDCLERCRVSQPTLTGPR